MKTKQKLLDNNTFNKAFKFRFYPDSAEIIYLAKTFGSVRFVSNKTLDFSKQHYQQQKLLKDKNLPYKNLNNSDRLNYLNTLKLEFPWLYDVSSVPLQQALINLNNAYKDFFSKKKGFPQVKRKSNRNSFKITGQNTIHFNEQGQFILPKCKKPLDIIFSKDFDRSKVSSVTVSKEPSGHYYISFLSIDNYKRLPSIQHKVAIDSGIKDNATTYNGKETQVFNLPDLKFIINRIKKLQKELSKKKIGSKNRDKARIKLAKAHETKANIIKDFYHKLSFNIVKDNQFIILESLNLNDMKSTTKQQHKNIRSSLHNISLSKLYEYIDYKADWYGKTVIYADKYYPSSKLCSQEECGYINHELSLSDRTWGCPSCGIVHDRDNNAAVNLYNYNEDNAKSVMNEVLAYHKKKQSIIVENKDKIDSKLFIGIKKPVSKSIKKINSKLKLNEYKEKSVNGILIEACGKQVSPDSNKELGIV